MPEKELKSMPREIKTKLKQLHNAVAKYRKLENEVEEMFESYGVDSNVMRGLSDIEADVNTEALTFILYNEGTAEENIEEIEKVFLHYANLIIQGGTRDVRRGYHISNEKSIS